MKSGNSASTEELQKAIASITEQRCWGVVAGSGTGSIFTLYLGGKIPRESPLSNQHLSNDVRSFDAEFMLMVWSSWLLDRSNKEICSSESDNSNFGIMVEGLKRLCGRKILDVEYIQAQGMYLCFEDDYYLSIFFDALEIYGSDGENFTIFTPDEIVSVNSQLEIVSGD